MKITKRVARLTAGALAGVMTLAVGGVIAFAAAAAAAPPFDPTVDAGWYGTITFYDAAGKVVTSGDATNPLSEVYAVASAVPAGVLIQKAGLFLYGPQPSVNPGLWGGVQLNGNVSYPITTAPAPVSTAGLNPATLETAASGNFANMSRSFTPTTGTLANVFQVRLKSAQLEAYAATTITIDPVTKIWTQIDPPPAPPVTTTTTPPVTTTTTPPVTTTTTPPVTTTTTPPVSTVTAVGSNGTALPDGSTLSAGDIVAMSGAGFTDGESVQVVLGSTPTTTLATVTATSAGTLTYSFTVPSTLANGSHTLTLQAQNSSAVFSFVIAAASSTTTPAPTSTTPVGTGVIPVGAPNTGAGGAAGSNDGLSGLGGLALLLAGAAATLVARRRQHI